MKNEIAQVRVSGGANGLKALAESIGVELKEDVAIEAMFTNYPENVEELRDALTDNWLVERVPALWVFHNGMGAARSAARAFMEREIGLEDVKKDKTGHYPKEAVKKAQAAWAAALDSLKNEQWTFPVQPPQGGSAVRSAAELLRNNQELLDSAMQALEEAKVANDPKALVAATKALANLLK
ncbi:MAG: hypothetical protein EBZ48_15000 [Proteobacteria bacterium]|nr:hypothetical protein [Pseudomonadota bacterium]